MTKFERYIDMLILYNKNILNKVINLKSLQKNKNKVIFGLSVINIIQ